MRLKQDYIVPGVLFVLAIAGGISFGKIAVSINDQITSEDQRIELAREKRKNIISRIADIDNDGTTTHEEWAKIYNNYGLRYDYQLSNPSEDLYFLP